jgi:general secretion pathway protein G
MQPLRRARGFTLIEMVVVMAMLGLLLSLAMPRYMASLQRGRAQVQQKNLATMREAIDKFYGDRGRYPERLQDLVELRYLRAIPLDPFTETPVWQVVPPKDPNLGGVYDVLAAPGGGEPTAELLELAAPDTPPAPAEEGGEAQTPASDTPDTRASVKGQP